MSFKYFHDDNNNINNTIIILISNNNIMIITTMAIGGNKVKLDGATTLYNCNFFSHSVVVVISSFDK